jgi:ATP-dependent 26S proteasome regulatory subunit
MRNMVIIFYLWAIIKNFCLGESARLIREMFNYARDHQPCIIFMDEIDAIGGRRFSEGKLTYRNIRLRFKVLFSNNITDHNFCMLL